MPALAFVLLSTLLAPGIPAAEPRDADVLVIGAGIAGLSAALEASAAGARVVVVELSSVPGGHAVKAGGFALVGTPLQEKKGYRDSADIAYADLMAWGEAADPDWVRRFVERSRTDIHDWLAGFGVRFTILLDTPEDTVPRFHFAGGTAVNVIVPLLREAYARADLTFAMNTRAERLERTGSGDLRILGRRLRTGEPVSFTAPAVVIATGGFESNLALVREHYRPPGSTTRRAPRSLLIGSGQYARGDGLAIGRDAGAGLTRLDRQVIFVNGLRDPRNPQRGLHVENPAAIRVDARGRRFVDEAADSKTLEAAVLGLEPAEHWLVFDERGRKKLRIRGAAWLNRDTIARELLGAPDVVNRADTLEQLAAEAGLPADALGATVERYNDSVADGRDAKPIEEPPFYAVRLLPMTRKSLGGLDIDLEARVLDTAGRPIDGLFAAGEATGVAGINGLHGGSGTFLAPSVLTGRIAGHNAAASAGLDARSPGVAAEISTGMPAKPSPMMDAAALRSLLARHRPGYWHWTRVHETVLERALDCRACHSPEWPTAPARTAAPKKLQADTCIRCH